MAFSVNNIGTGGSTSGASFTITVPAGGIPAGALIAVAVSDRATAYGTQAVTDSAGNTYTRGVSAIGSNVIGAWYYAYNVSALSAGQTITVTKSGSDNCAASAVYVTGMASGDPMDSAGSASAFLASSGQPSVTSGTPSTADCLLLAMDAVPGATATYTADSNWATPPNSTTTSALGAGRRVDGGYQVLSGTPTKTFAPTYSALPAAWAACILAIKPEGSGGTVYDDDVSFGLSLGIDPQASRVLDATATFAAVLAASTSNQAVLAGDVTLGILAGVTAGAALIAEAAVTLGMEAGLSQKAQADLNAAVVFATTLAATGGPNLTMETAVTLAAEAGIGSSGKITADAAAQFAIGLAQAAAAPISSNVYEEAVSFGLSMLVTSAADRVIDRDVEFGVGFGAQISASLNAAAHASFTMAFAAGVGAALEIVQRAQLDIAFSQEASGNLIVEGSVTLPIEVAAQYTANGILGAEVEFRAQFDQRASAILTANEAVILATKFAAEAVATTGQLPPRIIELHGQTESGMTLHGTMRLTVDLKGKVN